MKKGQSPGGVRPDSNKVTRRSFIKTTAATSAAVAAGYLGGQPPAFAQARKLHYLQWSSFIPDADTDIKRQAEEFTKASGVEVNVELINQNDMTPRLTAAIESGKGADVVLLINNQSHLFVNGLADHDALLTELGGDGLYEWAKGAVVVDGTARAVPLFNIGNAIVYRKDIFDEHGLSAPNTWDDYLKVGTTLKNNNWPIGQTLGHTFGDAPSFAYPALWSFGGMEVDESGKVVVNSAETRQALEFMREFWEAACDPGGLAWDDTSNNRAFLGQTISATLNGASIYFVAKRKYADLAPKLAHVNNPEGPRGPLPRHRAPCARDHEVLRAEGSRRGLHPLPVPGGQLQQLHQREQRYIQGLTPKWESHEIWDSIPP